MAKEREVPVNPKFEKKFSKYLERTEKGIEKLTDRQSISGQEFDKQIVALAGGGLALTITLSKDFLAQGADLVGFLFASWGCFLLALTANLISHRTSTEHYNLMIQRQQHYLDCAENDNSDIDEELDETLGKRINYRTKWVNGLNLGALIGCLLGIVFFIIFTFYNKDHADARPRPVPAKAIADPRSRPYQRPAGNHGATKPAPPTAGTRYDSAGGATGDEVKK
ncbi:hypothetical protein BEN49_04745 [Hymenobacter coccineus]|uniref:Uncharacterized protein n=1 Tax=Hymenobacter coccineus TaxID=1908235 RepID=A0A1G1TKS5_9BACT|nr:hypothetical protein BEN49_04745 [Hymenobacter coccineus]